MLAIVLLLIQYISPSPNWYTREHYKNLKRSVNWVPFQPEEHPFKRMTTLDIRNFIMNHSTEKKLILRKSSDKEKFREINSPDFYEIDSEEKFQKCIRDNYYELNECKNENLKVILNTLSWSECAFKNKEIEFSFLNFIQCDTEIKDSCLNPGIVVDLERYSDLNSKFGFELESCVPSINFEKLVSKKCSNSCKDKSYKKNIKIIHEVVPFNKNEIYHYLNNGIGLYVIFKSDENILHYKSGIYEFNKTSGTNTYFTGRVKGYDIYDLNLVIKVELGLNEYHGIKGNILLKNSDELQIYAIRSK